jgi:acyl carrier protein phosphodiesterase
MSTADHSPTVRRARELFSLQKWPHADHDLRIMWAHSDLDYDGGLVLISIAHQDY